jgi:hypothetical protein
MPDIPEELRRRIAIARSKALGESTGDIPATSVDDLEPQTFPDGVTPLTTEQLPAGLLERVSAARRQALEGLEPAPERNTVPVQDVPRITPERTPVTVALSTPASPPAAPEAPPAVVPAATAAPATAGMSLEQAAETLGMPEKLLRRSVDAKARALGVSFDEALVGMLGGAPSTTAGEAAPAETPAAPEAPPAAPEAPPAAVPAATAAPATAGMSLEQAAETLGMPEKLLRRSVDAKARALGVSFDEALAGMLGGTPSATPVEASVPSAPDAPASAAAPVVDTPAVPASTPAGVSAGMSFEQAAQALGYPEELFRRSVEAKAKALGVSVEETLAGMLGGAAPAAPAVEAAPVAPAVPAVEAAPAAPAAPPPQPAGVVSVEEAAAALGMPEKLFRRSVEAKAKALGVPFDQALAEMVGSPIAVTPAAVAPAPAVAQETATPVIEPAPTTPAAPVIAEVPSRDGETVESKQLYRVELATAVVSAVILALLALAGPAPVFRQAGGAADPSKIPWYLVWVAQLLAWIPREAAGFFAPLLVIVGLFAVPFVDRTTGTKVSSRRFALALFGIFVTALLVLTVIGLINRPGGFGWPWS